MTLAVKIGAGVAYCLLAVVAVSTLYHALPPRERDLEGGWLMAFILWPLLLIGCLVYLGPVRLGRWLGHAIRHVHASEER